MSSASDEYRRFIGKLVALEEKKSIKAPRVSRGRASVSVGLRPLRVTVTKTVYLRRAVPGVLPRRVRRRIVRRGRIVADASLEPLHVALGGAAYIRGELIDAGESDTGATKQETILEGVGTATAETELEPVYVTPGKPVYQERVVEVEEDTGEAREYKEDVLAKLLIEEYEVPAYEERTVKTESHAVIAKPDYVVSVATVELEGTGPGGEGGGQEQPGSGARPPDYEAGEETIVKLRILDSVLKKLAELKTATGDYLLPPTVRSALEEAGVEGGDNIDDYISYLETLKKYYQSLTGDERRRVEEATGKSVDEIIAEIDSYLSWLRQEKSAGASGIVTAKVDAEAVARAVKAMMHDAKAMLMAIKLHVDDRDYEELMKYIDKYYGLADDLLKCLNGDPNSPCSRLPPDRVSLYINQKLAKLRDILFAAEELWDRIKRKFTEINEKQKSRDDIPEKFRKIYEEWYKELREQGYDEMNTPASEDVAEFLLKDLVKWATLEPVFTKLLEKARELQEKADEIRAQVGGVKGELLGALYDALSYALVGGGALAVGAGEAVLAAVTGGVSLGVQLGAILGDSMKYVFSEEEREALIRGLKGLSTEEKALVAAMLLGVMAGGVAGAKAINPARESLARALARAANRLVETNPDLARTLARLSERLGKVKLEYVEAFESPDGREVVARVFDDDTVELAVYEHGKLVARADGKRGALKAVQAALEMRGSNEADVLKRVVEIVSRNVPREYFDRTLELILRDDVWRRSARFMRKFIDLLDEGRVKFSLDKLDEAVRAVSEGLGKGKLEYAVFDASKGRIFLLSPSEEYSGVVRLRLLDVYEASDLPDINISLLVERGDKGLIKRSFLMIPQNLDDESLSKVMKALLYDEGVLDELALETVQVTEGGVSQAFVPVYMRGEGGDTIALVGFTGRIKRVAVPTLEDGMVYLEHVMARGSTPTPEGLARVYSELVRLAYSGGGKGKLGDLEYAVFQKIRIRSNFASEVFRSLEDKIREYYSGGAAGGAGAGGAGGAGGVNADAVAGRLIGELYYETLARTARYIGEGLDPTQALERALNEIVGAPPEGVAAGLPRDLVRSAAAAFAEMVAGNDGMVQVMVRLAEQMSQNPALARRSVFVPLVSWEGDDLVITFAGLSGAEGAASALLGAVGGSMASTDVSSRVRYEEYTVEGGDLYVSKVVSSEEDEGTQRLPSPIVEPGRGTADYELEPVYVTLEGSAYVPRTVSVDSGMYESEDVTDLGTSQVDYELRPVYVTLEGDLYVSRVVSSEDARYAPRDAYEEGSAEADVELEPVYASIEVPVYRARTVKASEATVRPAKPLFEEAAAANDVELKPVYVFTEGSHEERRFVDGGVVRVRVRRRRRGVGVAKVDVSMGVVEVEKPVPVYINREATVEKPVEKRASSSTESTRAVQDVIQEPVYLERTVEGYLERYVEMTIQMQGQQQATVGSPGPSPARAFPAPPVGPPPVVTGGGGVVAGGGPGRSAREREKVVL